MSLNFEPKVKVNEIEALCAKLPRKASEGIYFELKPLKYSSKDSRWFVWVGERQGAPHFNRCASGKTQLEALTNLLNKPQPTKV